MTYSCNCISQAICMKATRFFPQKVMTFQNFKKTVNLIHLHHNILKFLKPIEPILHIKNIWKEKKGRRAFTQIHLATVPTHYSRSKKLLSHNPLLMSLSTNEYMHHRKWQHTKDMAHWEQSIQKKKKRKLKITWELDGIYSAFDSIWVKVHKTR